MYYSTCQSLLLLCLSWEKEEFRTHKSLTYKHKNLIFSSFQVEAFLGKLPGKKPIVVLISEAGEAVAIAEHLKHVTLSSEPIWLVGSLGLDLRTLTGWRKVFHGGLFVEPHMPELSEFKSYFIGALQVRPFFETLSTSCSGLNML